MKEFDIQAIFTDCYDGSQREHIKSVLRASYIQPAASRADVPALSGKVQHRMLRAALATREHQMRKYQPFAQDKIPPSKINEIAQRFFLEIYLKQSHFFIAGGFLLRVLEQPACDVGEIAAKNDIDIFYRDIQHVYDWIATLRANGVTVDRTGEYNHGLFTITAPSEPLPFLVQFTHTRAASLYELLESFDFPMCQIGIDTARRCFTTCGFDVAWENRGDAVISIHNGAYNNNFEEHFYKKRMAKYTERGYRFELTPHLVLYGRTKFKYDDDLDDDDEIRRAGEVDTFFASQTWIGGKTWADRGREQAAQ